MEIEEDNFSMTSKNIDTILTLPEPQSKKELIPYFTMFNYY